MSGAFRGGDFVEVPSATELQRILGCPVCSAVPLPPIFNCAAGHIICGDCRLKVEECGICRGEYSDSRNFLVEEIVRSSKMACEFRDQGCNLALTGDEFQRHIEDCDMRPIKCIYGHMHGCGSSEIPLKNYSNHLLRVHGFKSLSPGAKPFVFAYSMPGSNTAGDWCYKFGVIHDEKVFLLRSFLQANVFHFTLAIIGSESDASKYSVRLGLKQPEEATARMECVVPVVSIRKSDEEIMEEVHCLVPKGIMKKSICKVETTLTDEESLVWEIEYGILSKS